MRGCAPHSASGPRTTTEDRPMVSSALRSRGRGMLLSSCVAPCPEPSLPTQAQLLDEGAVALDVLGLEVLQQTAASAHQQEQATTAVMVVLVYLEVLGEIVDPPCQQSDLDLRRTGITLIGRVPGDDLLLDCCVQRHVCSLSFVTGLAGSHRALPQPRGRDQAIQDSPQPAA